jgi:hypothetical protein
MGTAQCCPAHAVSFQQQVSTAICTAPFSNLPPTLLCCRFPQLQAFNGEPLTEEDLEQGLAIFSPLEAAMQSALVRGNSWLIPHCSSKHQQQPYLVAQCMSLLPGHSHAAPPRVCL